MHVPAQLCPALCDPLDYSPPVSSVHGIFQARILEWVAISYSKDFPDPEKESVSLASPTLADGFFTTTPPFNCDLSVSKNPFLFFYTYRSLNKLVPLPWLRRSGMWIHSASQNSTDHVAVRTAKSNHQWLQIAKVSFSFILHILCGSNGTSIPSSPHSKLRLKEQPLSRVLPLAVQRGRELRRAHKGN